MKSMKIAAALAFVAGSTVGLAAERTISQKGKVFSESVVEIKKGETLVFLNDDNVPHNVLSTTSGHAFEIQVICAMHPSMKMSLKVAD
jgi:plastocyanin